jgi:hypothetical protein
MAEVLLDYEKPLTGDDGRRYAARACGREGDRGLWEGWIEFLPEDGSPVLRSERETTQPNRADTEYWATGITPIYLEGALRRTLEPREPVFEAPPGQPAYHGPAPHPEGARVAHAVAVLDPFSVRTKSGEEVLRRELGALRAWHLRNIVRAHGLADEHRVDLEALGEPDLVDLIVLATAVRVR